MRRRVLVIGGGLSGLLAAHRLQRSGDQVLLIESGSQVGGAIASAELPELPGLEVNAGAEAYAIGAGAVDALMDELGLAEQVVSPRDGLGSRLVSDAGVHISPGGALLGIPGRPFAADVRAVIGLGGALRAWLERFLPARIGNRPGASIDHVVRTRLGRRVAERLVAPVVGGVLSADPSALEFAAASPQLAGALREDGSLIAAVRRIRGSSTASAGTRVHSLTPSMARLPQRLQERVLAIGGMIRTGVTASAVEHDGSAWTVHTGSGETLQADHLVLACPPDTARDLLASARPRIAAAIPQAPSAPIRLVVLALAAPALDAFPAGTGALVAPGTAGIRAKALTHASAKWQHVQDAVRAQAPAGRRDSAHLVRLSYGRPGEELPAWEGLLDVALADASRILGATLTRDHLLGSRVIDWPDAMRQAQPGHRAALDALGDLLAEVRDLELVGSWRAGTGIDAIVRADAALASPPASPPEGHQS